MSKDEAINAGIRRLSELTGEDFHGYRSEIWGVLSSCYNAGLERAAEIARGYEPTERAVGVNYASDDILKASKEE